MLPVLCRTVGDLYTFLSEKVGGQRDVDAAETVITLRRLKTLTPEPRRGPLVWGTRPTRGCPGPCPQNLHLLVSHSLKIDFAPSGRRAGPWRRARRAWPSPQFAHFRTHECV
ncbi:hypothetical protein ACH4VM_04890 [Streptomyces sp. NPDC020792]|uniref:hypothetical protein n=1 Tax=Streptomyces sp. NPDC020792 TaxID=3365089 RepID=UPI00379252C5